MKRFVVLMVLFATILSSKAESYFGLGVGTQFGGYGAKYTHSLGDNRFFGGLGLYDNSALQDDIYAYTLGWEKMKNSRHAYGIFGRQYSRDGAYLQSGLYSNDVSYTLLGVSYTYYFKKASNSGFFAGFNLGKTYIDGDIDSYFDSGISFGGQFGYQF